MNGATPCAQGGGGVNHSGVTAHALMLGPAALPSTQGLAEVAHAVVRAWIGSQARPQPPVNSLAVLPCAVSQC